MSHVFVRDFHLPWISQGKSPLRCLQDRTARRHVCGAGVAARAAPGPRRYALIPGPASGGMENLASSLEKLSDADERRAFELAGMLVDPLTRGIMARLAGQGPVSADGVPEGPGGRGAVISRLARLERAGLLESEKAKAEDGFCKKYFINEKGKEIVSRYMQKESGQLA